LRTNLTFSPQEEHATFLRPPHVGQFIFPPVPPQLGHDACTLPFSHSLH
jgi:hypothetical protein